MFVRRRAFSRAVTHKNHRGYTTDAQSSRKARDIEKKLPPHLQERVVRCFSNTFFTRSIGYTTHPNQA